MSKRHHTDMCQCRPMVMPQTNENCICSLPTLIILILIVLQFSKHNKGYSCDRDDDYDDCDRHDKKCCDQQVGNGVLFIIALFFLSCVGCGKGRY